MPDGVQMEFKVDRKALRYFKSQAPQKLVRARENAVEAMGMVWADSAKSITRNEDHIDTGLYINSIGYSTGSPSQPINEMRNESRKTVLTTGANVEYAASLESRYAIFARALDNGSGRMKNVATTQIKNTLGL